MNLINFYYLFGQFVTVFLLIFVPLYLLYISVWKYGIIPFLSKNHLFKPQKDSWAIVTGCTEGIGREFALQLAKKGYNLCLISRNQAKLIKLKDEIYNKFSQCEQVKTIAFDFSSIEYEKLDKELESISRVDCLVNNVGVMVCEDSCPEFFHLQSAVDIHNNIKINIFTATHLIHTLSSIMENQKNGATIINVSSMIGIWPSPLYSVYSSTKRYVDIFSRSLAWEYASKKIIVYSLVMGTAGTRLNPFSRQLFSISSHNYVSSVLKSIRKSESSAGCWLHEIAIFLYTWIPILSWSSDLNVTNLNRVKMRLRKKMYHLKGKQITYGKSTDFRDDIISRIFKIFDFQPDT
ncbi:putative steroid dehydrogenase 4 [Brevipalpus obovatus]|uniref:putative steroid dehydrogenase 4 n=1 Tax=Brevipalpus obovatus TaxID=246614 RepID=UPI003D9E769E